MSSKKQNKGLRIGIVGATGMVGRVLIDLIEAHRFPVSTLLPFSSGKKSSVVRFQNKTIPAPGISIKALHSADLVFMVSSDEVSMRYSKALAASGIWVIDDSSAYRLDPDVPLVIPEINATTLTPDTRLIAGPNCTITGPAVAGYPLHKKYEVTAVRMASYQAVSGAGRAALIEFYEQTRKIAGSLTANSLFPKASCRKPVSLPQQIAFNVFPQVGSFDPQGNSGEENKVRAELRKIWSAPRLGLSATTVRVPVVRGHSIALWLETRRAITPAQARTLLSRAPGLKLWEQPRYPTPLSAAFTEPVHVARIRPSGASPRELALWIVSDNLLKGAALNSVHIAQHLLAKGWLRGKVRL